MELGVGRLDLLDRACLKYRLLFAGRNEGNHSWTLETMEADEIETAFEVEWDRDHG